MKKMVKAAILALAAAGMVVLGGCGSSQPAKSQGGSAYFPERPHAENQKGW